MRDNLTATAARESRTLLPDARFVRREIPISEVAARLGLKGTGRYLFCWREGHAKRDRRPSVGIHVKSNSVRCFQCDARNLSPVDLVQDVLGISVGAAFRWFQSEWSDIPKVRLKVTTSEHSKAQDVHRSYAARPWPTLTCDALVLSPGWARLSHDGRALAAAIVARVPRELDVHPLLACSYQALQGWTGIGNRRTIARALRELRGIGLIQIALAPTGRETERGRATYQTLVRLTCWSRRFVDWIEEGAQSENQRRTAPATGLQWHKCHSHRGGKMRRSPLASWKPARGERLQ